MEVTKVRLEKKEPFWTPYRKSLVRYTAVIIACSLFVGFQLGQMF